ncbi:MAG: GDP-mannose 4,6-dehydratase [Sphaerochaetaceae bacterium]|nr:GDP-mannose 4,6-dehydratase [Sphaerochaetaceae bacterium]
MKKTALITGITGQDGSYLAEFLLDKGYEVHGTVRRSSVSNTVRIDSLLRKNHIALHNADLTDSLSIVNVLAAVRPCEIYNLAAQSHVQVSFEVPEYSADVDAMGTLRLLESMRTLGLNHTCRFYQASTSELFGKVEEIPQSESTPFHPYSPYAIAKQYAYWIVKEYREAYGMFAVNGILFNHESERRGENFVTRKITLAAGRIACGLQDCLYLGNLNSLRDWGYAKDYVECMWLMLQHDRPEDFIIATGEQHTVRDFVTRAFSVCGLTIEWKGTGLDEIGVDVQSGRTVVRIHPDFFRPTDVDNLLGNPEKARRILGWNPTSTSYEQLVEKMALHDFQLAQEELRSQGK